MQLQRIATVTSREPLEANSSATCTHTRVISVIALLLERTAVQCPTPALSPGPPSSTPDTSRDGHAPRKIENVKHARSGMPHPGAASLVRRLSASPWGFPALRTEGVEERCARSALSPVSLRRHRACLRPFRVSRNAPGKATQALATGPLTSDRLNALLDTSLDSLELLSSHVLARSLARGCSCEETRGKGSPLL